MQGRKFGAWGGGIGVAGGMVHAVRALRGRGVERPVVLATTPAYANNPFQELLLRGCWDEGIAPVAIPSLLDLAQAGIAVRLGAEVVVHLHWTNQLQRPDRHETEANHATFREDLAALQADGVKVVWTLHNRLPHECPHPDLEVALRRWLVDRVDVVHVMGAATAEAVADLYPLDPAKVVTVPHPSYEGVYPATVDRAQARWELGLAPDEEALLLFGGIRPYKDVPLALAALDELLTRGRSVRLVVAGAMVGSWDGDVALEDALLLHPAVQAHVGRIAEVDVQRFFGAADALLLPYTSIINSGVLLLGVTWGVPTVATAAGEVGGIVEDGGLGATFDTTGGARALADAVERVLAMDRPTVAASAADYTAALRPDLIAARYRRDVVDRVLSR